jgi:hypothetical protein
MVVVMKGKIKYLTAKEAWEFLKPRHYAGRKPQISKAYGWEIEGELVAVATFGKPASPSLCVGICGAEHSSSVYELNRLCRVEELKEPLSAFVSACLRRLRVENWIIVSYSDTGMHHNGYIYQACNFVYTGQTKQRTDKWTENGKHPRHYDNQNQSEYRIVRTAKNRYVYFCTFDKKKKKEWMQALNYPILPYPKEDNENYILGQYQKPIVVSADTGEIVNV